MMSSLRSSMYCVFVAMLFLCITPCADAQTSRTIDWGGSTVLSSSGDGEDRSYPQAAMGGQGNAIVVWQESSSATMVISARIYSDGQWGEVERLSTGTFSSYMPEVAMNDKGDALVVWHQSDGAKNVINARTYVNGSWMSVETISAGPGSAEEPMVSMNDYGDAVTIWRQTDGAVSEVNAAVRSNGIWTGATTLSAATGDLYTPQAAISNSGEAVAVWYETDGRWEALYASAFSEGAWGEAIRLSKAEDLHNYDAQVAMGNYGEAVVAWRETVGDKNHIIARIFTSGSWGSEAVLSMSSFRAFRPQVAMNGNGTAVAVWNDNDGTKDTVAIATYSGGTWGPTATISNGTDDSYFPQVAMNDRGDIVAVWSEPYNYGTNKLARTCFDGAWGEVERLTDWIGGLGLHQVAIDLDGDALVVWHQPDGYAKAIGMSNLWVLPTATIGPGGSDVAVETTVTATFSEPMDHDTVSINVSGVTGMVTWDGNVAIFTPSIGLGYNTMYAVNVQGKDIDGNSVSIGSTFTTLKDECMISGIVTDIDGLAVANATVALSNGMSSTTDESGAFQITGVPSGWHTMNITKDGYGTLTSTVKAVAGQSIEVGTLSLTAVPPGSNDEVWPIVILAAVGAMIATVFVMRRRRK